MRDNAFQFGLSTLHARIRFMEYFLHLSYRLGFKKWQAKGDDHVGMLQKKREIQQAFKRQLGRLYNIFPKTISPNTISPNDFSPKDISPNVLFPRMYRFPENRFPECTVSPKTASPNVPYPRKPFPRKYLFPENRFP